MDCRHLMGEQFGKGKGKGGSVKASAIHDKGSAENRHAERKVEPRHFEYTEK